MLYYIRANSFSLVRTLIAITVSLVIATAWVPLSTFAAGLTGPPPASGKQFTTLPEGSALPSNDECASRIRRTSWEPRPNNMTKNQYTAVKGSDYNLKQYAGTDRGIYLTGHAAKANAILNRVDGNFKGTTDEILQWAACKWGFDEDVARAQAVIESNWDMAANGDGGESFGILQVRNTTFPDAFPAPQKSTAFNADFTFANWRMCYEGLIDYLAENGTGYAAGDSWGCVGKWYTGNWYGSGGGGSASGAQGYIDAVKQQLNARVWDSWSGIQISSTPATSAPTRAPTSGQSPTSPPGCSLKPIGDADCNGKIDLIDFETFRKEMTGVANTKTADFNTDGTVNVTDFEVWRKGFFRIT